MRRGVLLAYPPLFGVLNFLLYEFLYRPQGNSPELAVAGLAFFAALGWSALIFKRDEPLSGWRRLYVVVTIAAPPLLALLFPGMKITLYPHGLIYLLILLGMAMLCLYLRLASRKSKSAPAR